MLIGTPSTCDKDIDNLDDFHDPSEDDHENYHFDQYGEYRHQTFATHNTCTEEEFYDACEFLSFDDQVDDLMDAVHPELVNNIYGISSSEVAKVSPKFELLCPLFGWDPADTFKRMFKVTTQYARGRVSDALKQH
jgi:hypothetical protein